MKKILFLAAHRPGRSPGQRFRFEQYLPYLQENGFHCEVSFLLDADDDAVFYKKGHYFRKLLIFLKAIRIRLRDLRRAKDFDIIFIYREAVMFGSVCFEKRMAHKGAKLVLDYDDAIWLKDVSEGNRRLAWLKRPTKTADIIGFCHLIITGNNYLATYARQFSSHVTVVPTTLETDLFKRNTPCLSATPICIGWTGSITTLRHLELALPVLQQLYAHYGDTICFRVIADREWNHPGLPVEFIHWNRETEIEDLSAIHIGIMPLPDDDWARGKCGFKGLQYMALGIPAVMSPVGVNSEIIIDGENGFLANSQQEWFSKICLLIEDASLRERLGKAGRKTIEEKYSYNAWKENYLHLLENI